MPRARLVVLTALTLAAFAANSLLCRAALAVEGMDAVSFTLVRLASGAVVLLGLLATRRRVRAALAAGSWTSGAVLLGYALLFSLAYRSIPAGVGALVLFASVQLTMLMAAVRAGDGPRPMGWVGVVAALGGLAGLTVPGAAAPDALGVALMAGSGVSWGLYSLRGRGAVRPAEETAVGFAYAAALVLPVCLVWLGPLPAAFTLRGLALAATSGAVTSGLGYVLWYAVLPHIATTRAAVLQLAVPVIAATAGALLLGESVSTRLVLSSVAILGGIALVLRFSHAGHRGTSQGGARSRRCSTS